MAGRAALGKGLRALIPDIQPEEEERAESIREVEVTKISPNPFQPRENFDPIALEELKRSIAEKGVIQPITVRPHDSGYQLIAGERRWRAVRDLGFKKIPAYVREEVSDEDMLELSIVENIHREDLNPIDLARGYQRLITECKLTQEEVAKKVGKDRTTVTNFIRLLKLPPQIQNSLKTDEVSMGHARALINVSDRRVQMSIWNRIIRENLSVRKVEALVKQSEEERSPSGRSSPLQVPFYIREAEDRLRQLLGTKVRVRPGDKGGKIEVEFYSEEDLDRILSVIEGST